MFQAYAPASPVHCSSASGSPVSRIAGHQPGRPGRAVTIAARGTATQFSSNSGQNSGA
jgi:hypothetical protein